jgi:hypothetical protein
MRGGQKNTKKNMHVNVQIRRVVQLWVARSGLYSEAKSERSVKVTFGGN